MSLRGSSRQRALDGVGHLIGERRIVGDQDALRRGIVLGLAQQVGGDPVGIVGAIGDHQDFRRPGDGIDADLAEHFALGGGDIGVAGAHDLVHRRDAFACRRPARRRPARRRCDRFRVTPARFRGGQHQRIDLAAAGRRHHHDAGDAGDARRESRSSAPNSDSSPCRRAHRGRRCRARVQRQPSVAPVSSVKLSSLGSWRR